MNTLKIKDGFVKSEVAGQKIAVPVGDRSVERNCMIRLNGTGSLLWDSLQEPATIDELVAALCEHYEVDEATARADAEEFIEALRAADLLEGAE